MPIRRVAYVIARFEVEADVGDIDFTDEHLLILEDPHSLNPGQIRGRNLLSHFKCLGYKTAPKLLLFLSISR